MNYPLVVGLGSHHGDDQAGWLVLNELHERGYPLDRLLRARHPAELLDAIDADMGLIIGDACQGTCAPGSIHHFHWPTTKLIYQRPSGSHDMSLGDVLTLGHQLHGFPTTADIWAIEGISWSAGIEPTQEIQQAAVQVAERIMEVTRNA